MPELNTPGPVDPHPDPFPAQLRELAAHARWQMFTLAELVIIELAIGAQPRGDEPAAELLAEVQDELCHRGVQPL